MFFSEQLLTDRGPLAQVWLAANLEKKLKRSDLLNTDIPKSVKAIVDSEKKVPMALRLSGQLLLGVVRIYGRQTGYLLDDCSHTVTKIKMTFKPGNVDLPTISGSGRNTSKASAALTLGNAITDLDLALPPAPVIPGLNLPGLNLGLDEFMPVSNANLVSNATDITLPQHDMSIEIGRADEEDELADLGDDLDLDLGLDLDGELNLDEPAGDLEMANQSIEIPRGDDDELANLDDGLDLGLDLGMDNLEEELAAQQASEQLDLPMSPIEPADLLEEDDGLTLEEPTINMADALAGNIPEVSAPAPRKRRANRGKRAKFDDETQLDQDFVQQQRRNRDGIIYEHPQLEAFEKEANLFNDLSADIMALVDPEAIRKTLSSREVRDDEEQVMTPAASPNGKRAFEEVDQDEEEAQHDPLSEMPMDIPDDLVMENTETVDELAAAAEEEEDLLVTGTVDGIAKSTIATAQTLRRQMSGDDNKVQFSELIAGKGRKAAVQSFFEVLVLATKDTISINQPSPYADFSVSAKDNLFDDMWSESSTEIAA
ncbi:Cohesin subunit rad21 [Yarrowia sp. C11]|nr:Cohesin subunit rad21 [Yarrowia sp. E02]KAG5372998.1 Cohesin subunit rad21 [Yarrowia sp. C11]